jgi:hypothetical protein
MSVVSLVAQIPDEGSEPIIGKFTDITELPRDIAILIQEKVPTFKKVYSKTTNGEYCCNATENLPSNYLYIGAL